MTITYKIYDFPTIPIAEQLFSVPGAMIEGGFTSGGVRISTSEPGGFGQLELVPSLQVNEWLYPTASWLMSKTNGELLRFRLAPTPQVSTAMLLRTGAGLPWDNEEMWNHLQNWDGDITTIFLTEALEGSNTVSIMLSDIGELLRFGHVIGHGDTTYFIDEIEYDGDGNAAIVVKPPFRKTVQIGDLAFMRPFFVGQIANGGEIRSTYKASGNGTIQPGKILLNEVIL